MRLDLGEHRIGDKGRWELEEHPIGQVESSRQVAALEPQVAAFALLLRFRARVEKHKRSLRAPEKYRIIALLEPHR